MNTGYDSTDLFCGAGGSGLGAWAAGVELVMAANHSPIAIETHSANFPDTEHDCADISQVDPRRYRRTRFLWASPECTNHSEAKGRKSVAQQDLFNPPDPVTERSRATMWDVVRFAEHHRYDVVIVENVVKVTDWELWSAWLYAMKALGYAAQVVSLNSMHAAGERAPRAPQSRDRVYVVFSRDGLPTPDVAPRPQAWCGTCDALVGSVQWWKTGRRIGKYRQQYLYRCPTCHQVVEPAAVPAEAVIDWTNPGQRIGDRARPLSPKTVARIVAGLRRYAAVAQLVPVEGRDGVSVSPVSQPMRTQTARHETALVVPYYGTGRTHPANEPLHTVSTRDRFGLAFIASLRGGGCQDKVYGVDEPLNTVTASGQHHMLVRHNSTHGDPGYLSTPVTEPARTITTRGHQSLVGFIPPVATVDDCTFRMLTIPEIQAAMAFTPDYRVLGNKRQRVMQLGNAVTPPASEWLYRQCIQALETA